MKKYDFDEVVNRRGTDCIKYDALSPVFGSDDILPLWVADTDFRTPDFILKAIRKRLDHEILGYTFRGDAYHEAIVQWVEKRHGWKIRKEWISFSPGVVSALAVAVLANTRPGDKVIVQPPVYTPFFECITGLHREVLENPLKLVNGQYHFDLEDLERKMDENPRMMMLCNPHNPGGMVWSGKDLEAVQSICASRNVMVVSDEIHSDLVYSGNKHTSFGMVSEWSSQNSIVCMSPSKTFNVAGLSTSFEVIPNPRLKKSFDTMMEILHVHTGNIAGKIALESAFTQGEEWLRQMMEYVEGNFRFLESYLSAHLPKIRVIKPQATFLVWLDFREYGMNDDQLSRFLVEKAKVGLNEGAKFGTGGEGFQRINIGCPRSVLKEALERIQKAFNTLGNRL